jgi:hypothetical protein
MLKAPEDFDNNRSKDVPGPKLTRPYQSEAKMAKDSYSNSPSGFNDTQVMSKHDLSDLHQGHIETPLSALGGQSLVEKAEMGSKMAAAMPKVQSGGMKDAQRVGLGAREKKGLGRSEVKKALYAEKEKDKY